MDNVLNQHWKGVIKENRLIARFKRVINKNNKEIE
jgi:hypothetical protein